MKLKIGLLSASPAWEQLLKQEGVPFGNVGIDTLASAECSVLVVNRMLSGTERTAVEGYLREGGGVLGFAHYLQGVSGLEISPERLDYVVADNDEVFADIHILDVGMNGTIPRGANALRTQSNTYAILAGQFGGGHAVLLPIDVVDLLMDNRGANKSFYSTRERLPSERVSLVGKGELRRLLHVSFQFLHHVRDLPYAHLWYYPAGRRNLFAFRVDTDGAPKSDIDDLYALASKHKVSMTWFLDVKSHLEWLGHFAFMTNQEIGLHCFEHETYPGLEMNLENISRARRAMEAVGLHPGGFAAPYGRWNEALATAVDQIGFEYSSEFSFAYDTFPMYPETVNGRFATLQVPIHPICVGSMRRVGYTDEQMIEYFRRVVHQKLRRDEPLFFYHHPSHRRWNVIDALVGEVLEKGIDNVSMEDYAQWWKKRLRYAIQLELKENVLEVATLQTDDDVWLRITKPSGLEAIVRPRSRIDLASQTWRMREPPLPPPADIRRVREFDPRAMLGDLFTTMMRRLR